MLQLGGVLAASTRRELISQRVSNQSSVESAGLIGGA
jgi:hypothetical protein